MPKPTRRSLKFDAADKGKVSGILLLPARASCLYVVAHGAGAGMKHAFMEDIANTLADQGIATFRYQFPYMEQGKKRVDSPKVSTATVRAAVAAAQKAAPGLPLIAGGKSFGGRMTSTAASEEELPDIRGLAFLGFPLHAPGRPGNERAAHLFDVSVPMLFLQGTRDTFADAEQLKPVIKKLKKKATLHWVEGGDHGFKVTKRSGRTHEEVLTELADTLAAWAGRL